MLNIRLILITGNCIVPEPPVSKYLMENAIAAAAAKMSAKEIVLMGKIRKITLSL